MADRWEQFVEAMNRAGYVVTPATSEPPKPQPERVGVVAKRVREAFGAPDAAGLIGILVRLDDARRLLACAEASDEYERTVGQPGAWNAWRRTVTGDTT